MCTKIDIFKTVTSPPLPQSRPHLFLYPPLLFIVIAFLSFNLIILSPTAVRVARKSELSAFSHAVFIR